MLTPSCQLQISINIIGRGKIETGRKQTLSLMPQIHSNQPQGSLGD